MIRIRYRRWGGTSVGTIKRRTGHHWWLTEDGTSVHAEQITDGLTLAEGLPIERCAPRPAVGALGGHRFISHPRRTS